MPASWNPDAGDFDPTETAARPQLSVWEDQPSPDAAPEAWLGKCLAADDVASDGRCLVGYIDGDGRACRVWALRLRGVDLCGGDRVVMMQCGNCEEPVIVGVVALAPRLPKEKAAPNPQITLSADESLQVLAANGSELLHISQTDAGPLVRLSQPDVQLELPGDFHLSAAARFVLSPPGRRAIGSVGRRGRARPGHSPELIGAGVAHCRGAVRWHN